MKRREFERTDARLFCIPRTFPIFFRRERSRGNSIVRAANAKFSDDDCRRGLRGEEKQCAITDLHSAGIVRKITPLKCGGPNIRLVLCEIYTCSSRHINERHSVVSHVSAHKLPSANEPSARYRSRAICIMYRRDVRMYLHFISRVQSRRPYTII